MRNARKPEIVADAAYAIFPSPAREFTGRFLIDDNFLAERGVSDFDRYRVDPREPWRPTSSCRTTSRRPRRSNRRNALMEAVRDLSRSARRHWLCAQVRRRFAPALDEGLFGDLGMEDVDAVLAEAGRFAGEVLAPLNRIGDRSARPSRTAPSPPRRAGRKPTRLARAAGMASRRRREWGGQALPQSSMPPASKCGTRPPWRSASARC